MVFSTLEMVSRVLVPELLFPLFPLKDKGYHCTRNIDDIRICTMDDDSRERRHHSCCVEMHAFGIYFLNSFPSTADGLSDCFPC